MELVAGRPFKKMQIINMVLQQDPWSSSLWFVRAFCETWTFLTFQTCMNKDFFALGLFGKWPSLWHPVTIRTIQDLWSNTGVKDQVAGGCPLQQMTHGQNMDLVHIFSGVSFLFYLEVWTKHSVLIFLERIPTHFLYLSSGIRHWEHWMNHDNHLLYLKWINCICRKLRFRLKLESEKLRLLKSFCIHISRPIKTIPILERACVK